MLFCFLGIVPWFFLVAGLLEKEHVVLPFFFSRVFCCLRIFAGGELALSVTGNASCGCVVRFNIAFKVKFGLPGLAFLPKWYWKMYLWPSACDNMLGTWYVSLSSTELTTELQSGTKVCASGLKHVIVVVAVPSSTIALKQ
nr:hypothetical protein [Tanacetum cinerariifolium]